MRLVIPMPRNAVETGSGTGVDSPAAETVGGTLSTLDEQGDPALVTVAEKVNAAVAATAASTAFERFMNSFLLMS